MYSCREEGFVEARRRLSKKGPELFLLAVRVWPIGPPGRTRSATSSPSAARGGMRPTRARSSASDTLAAIQKYREQAEGSFKQGAEDAKVEPSASSGAPPPPSKSPVVLAIGPKSSSGSCSVGGGASAMPRWAVQAPASATPQDPSVPGYAITAAARLAQHSRADGAGGRLTQLAEGVVAGFGEAKGRKQRVICGSASAARDSAISAMQEAAIRTRLANLGGAASPERATAQFCKLHGPGLRWPMVRQVATFTIEAYDAAGRRKDVGGDSFFVLIKACGHRVRARVTDAQDGSYMVTYKPEHSGRYEIIVSVHGDMLPGCPIACLARSPKVSASHCVVRGDALRRVVARERHAFEVEFKDAVGQVTHAEDLDVHVVPLGVHTADSEAAPDDVDSEAAWQRERSSARAVNSDASPTARGYRTPPAAQGSARARSAPPDRPRPGEDATPEGELLHCSPSSLVSAAAASPATPAHLAVPKLRTGLITSKDPLIVRSGLALDSERICALHPGVSRECPRPRQSPRPRPCPRHRTPSPRHRSPPSHGWRR